MVEVAQATVTIIPTMQGAQQSITEQLTGEASKAGNTAGQTMGNNLSNSASKSMNFTKVGTAMTKGVTLPLVAIGTASVAAFKEVDAGLDIVTTKTGATGDALEGMHKITKDIATSIPTDFNTAGEAVGEVNTRFGVTGKTLESLSTEYIKFARINNQDVSSSVDNTSKALAAFGLDVNSASSYLDALNVVGQQTGVDVGTLSQQVSANAAQFQAMGMDINQATMFLGQCDKAGLDTSTAMMGMKTAMKNAAKEGKTLDEAMADFSQTMQGNGTETEKLQAAYELFGTRAGAAIYNACSQGQLDLDNLTGSLGEFEGSVDQTFADVVSPTEEFTTALNSLKEVGAELGSSLMTTLAPIIKEVAEKIKSFGEWFSNLSPGMQSAIVKVGLFAAACGPVLSVIGKVGTGIGTLKSLFGGLTSVLGKASGAVSSASSEISGAVSGGGGFAALKNWLSQDMSTACSTFQGTLGTIGAAIGTFTASYSLTTWVLEQTGAMEKLQDWAVNTKLNLFDFAGGNSGGWDERYEQACQKVEAASSGLYQLTSADLQELGAVEQHYSEQSTKFWNINKGESEAKANTMQSYTNLANTLLAQQGTAATTLSQTETTAAQTMQTAFETESIASTTARTSITSDQQALATESITTATTFSQSMSQVGTDSGTAATTVNQNMGNLKGAVNQSMTEAETTATTKASSIKDKLSSSSTEASTTVNGQFSFLKSAVSSSMSSAESDVNSKTNSIKSKITSNTNSAATGAQNNFKKINTAANSNLSSAESRVNSSVQNIRNSFTSQNWSSVGSNAMEGIKGGLMSMVSNLASAAASAAKSMLDAAKGALGISSPSKVFEEEVGFFIPSGVASGVEKKTPVMIRSAQESVDTMMESIRLPSPAEYASFGSSVLSMMQQGFVPQEPMAAAAGAGGGGDIIIPVYIGREHIQDIVVTAQQIHNYRSGGR